MAIADTSRALLDIAAERRRQMDAEGWSPEHDDRHVQRELVFAAICYAGGDHRLNLVDASGAAVKRASIWPWHLSWWKPSSTRRNLVKAAALIAAEIERIDRADARIPKHGTPERFALDAEID